jgi:phosphomannomutase/phosphoglucomutase
VLRLGVVPTPLLYWAVHTLGLGGGAQITGSHNPPEYNGIKLLRGTEALTGPDIQDLRCRAERGMTEKAAPGRAEARDLREAYLDDIVARVRLDRPLRVVLDAGNGCAGDLAPRLFERLGCTVEGLYLEPDGTFPHHIPDPTLPETLVALRERVLAGGADLGIAYDGDADRLGALDERGRVAWGDQLLALFAREVLAREPGAPILFEVKCSQALSDDIRAHGGEPVMTRTGHSWIKKTLREIRSPLAGEMSGHLFFADGWYGFDDALYASARLARLVAASERPFSALLDALPRYVASPEIRIDCDDARKFAVVEAVTARFRDTHPVNEVDGARILFPGGWGLVRASNTQPALVVRAEGKTEAIRDGILDTLREAVNRAGGSWS